MQQVLEAEMTSFLGAATYERNGTALDTLEPSGYLEVFIPFHPKPCYSSK